MIELNEIKLINTMTKMKRFYLIYCRKSSESEDRQCESIEDQQKILLDLAKSRNLKVIQSFTESKSAKAPGRPVYNEMLRTIMQRGDIKGILCWKLNRLFRNPVDEGNMRWMIQNKDIDEIHTPSKTYYAVDSDFVMAVEGSQAQRFIKDLRDDTMRGTQKKIRAGQAPILALPGYVNNKFKNQGQRDISPDPIQFPIMRKLMSLALSGNYSIQRLYEKALEMGLKNQLGRPVSRTRIYDCLKNPFYTGKFLYKGEIYQGAHEPMITDDEYDLIQKIYGFPSKARYSKNSDLLTGTIKCTCGGWITGDKKTKASGSVYIYYKCSRKGKRCNSPQISGKEMEKQILSFLSSIKLKPIYIDWFVKWLRKTNENKNTIKAAQKASLTTSLRNIDIKIQNLLNMKLSDQNINSEMISDQEYKEVRMRLLKERDLIYRQLKGLDDRCDEIDDLMVKTFNFATRATEKLVNGNIIEKRTVLKALGSNLVLNNGKVEITPRSMFKVLQDKILGINRIELKDGALQTSKPSNMSVLYPLPDSPIIIGTHQQ